jgi:hypothetical protein
MVSDNGLDHRRVDTSGTCVLVPTEDLFATLAGRDRLFRRTPKRVGREESAQCVEIAVFERRGYPVGK